MTFDEWFEAEQKAERLYWADEEGARAAWQACERQLLQRMVEVTVAALGVEVDA